ncbi:hypothetical protein ACMA1D_29070 [Streptomyces sp. 796.1]|uniref:hypothetical protein n=1 Tax=Streptomyces sp. 796.1 TaxID=3163029 RepID=UPI0039C97767
MASESVAGALAPLKDGLDEDKRALAQMLRELFGCLNISVRRYALRRPLDKGTVSRYLNGSRTPPWSFVVDLMADIAEEGTPVTPEVEEALRELHGRARRAGSARAGTASEVQRLQDRLAEADEEASRGKVHARALTEVLRDRQRQLVELQGKLNRLEKERAEDHCAYERSVIAWRGTYQELREERDRLVHEVDELRGALADAKREVFAAEEHCTELEGQLAEAERRAGEAGVRMGLLEILETTDRTASVPQLVELVTHLTVPGRTATATELVKSAGQARPVAEAAALMAALYGAGHHRQAEAALPALVLVRPAADTAVFIEHFAAAGLDAATATVMKTSLEIHPVADVAAVALGLAAAGQQENVRVYLGAAATVRPLGDVVDLVSLLGRRGARQAVDAALGVCARERPVQEVAELCELLLGRDEQDAITCLERVVAEVRPARDVVDLAALADRFSPVDADFVLGHSAHHRRDQHGYLVALVTALHTVRLRFGPGQLLAQAVRDWGVRDVGHLVGALHVAGHWQYAVGVLTEALHAHPVPAAADLLATVDADLDGGAWAVLSDACVVQPPEELAALIALLGACGARAHAERVFWKGLRGRVAGHAVQLVRSLHYDASPLLAPGALEGYARRATADDVVELGCALEGAGQRAAARALLAAAAGRDRAHFLPVLGALAGRDQRLAEFLVRDVALAESVPGRVRLALVLAALPAETARFERCLLEALRQADPGEWAEFTRRVKAARKLQKKVGDQVARDGIRRDRRQRRREFVRNVPGFPGRTADRPREPEAVPGGW